MIFGGSEVSLDLGVPHFETLRQPLSKERRQSAASSVAWLRKLEPPYWLSSNIFIHFHTFSYIFHINHGGDFGGAIIHQHMDYIHIYIYIIIYDCDMIRIYMAYFMTSFSFAVSCFSWLNAILPLETAAAWGWWAGSSGLPGLLEFLSKRFEDWDLGRAQEGEEGEKRKAPVPAITILWYCRLSDRLVYTYICIYIYIDYWLPIIWCTVDYQISIPIYI